MKYKKIITCGCIFGSPVVMVQAAERGIQSGTARVEGLVQKLGAPTHGVTGTSHLAVHSQGAPTLPGVSFIFVNGNCHAWLTLVGLSEWCYSTGHVEIGARLMEVAHRSRDRSATIKHALLGARTHDLRVREQGGRTLWLPVPAAQPEHELPSKRLQLNTPPRLAHVAILSSEPVQAASSQPVPTRHAQTLTRRLRGTCLPACRALARANGFSQPVNALTTHRHANSTRFTRTS